LKPKLRPRAKIDLTVFDSIERAVKEGLIAKDQATKLNAKFVENCLEAIKSRKMSSVGIGNLEMKIWGLPQKERLKLLTLLNEVNASFGKR